MSSFEFEIKDNLSLTYGEAEGYFTVKPNSALIVSGIMMLDGDIKDYEKQSERQKYIPLILNEFGQGVELPKYLTLFKDCIPGFVTFGADENAYARNITTQSHLSIVSRELATEQHFLAPFCKTPNDTSISSWEVHSPLLAFDHRDGSIVVKRDVCIVSIDESVEPLPSLLDDYPTS